MKKKKKISLKCLSALLTLCLMLSVVFSAPVTVTAATVGERNDITVSDVAVSKVESIDGNEEVKRTPIRRLYEEEGNNLNKTIWLNDDGTRTMTIYDYPVKFVNAAGQIQDISLDVAEAADGSGAFKTAAGWTNTVFPSKITDGVTLSGNGESLKLTPVMPQGSLVASAEISNKLVAKDKVSRKDFKTVSYNYDSKTNIEYSLTYNGFKEDIVVNEYTGQTEYSFLLETNGLTLVNNNGSYHLEDAKGNIKASVGDVIIFTADERNNTMGYMTHTTVKENHIYFLTIHVDADWLKDEKTVYPIRIDPTLEMTDTEKLVEDVTIYSGGASNPTSAVLYVGRRPDALGTSRVLLKFPNLDLSDINSAKNVVSAGIRMRDLMCETDPMGVYCYIYDGNNWEDNTATWANNAEGYTHFMSHNDVSYNAGAKKSPKHSYYFSITPAVKYWKLTDAEKAARPDNYDMEKGIMLKAKNDTTMDYQYKSFGSYNRSNYRPTIEIVYNNNTASPSKPFGWFDKVTDTEISGWAWCFDYPYEALTCGAYLYNETTGVTYSDYGLANHDRPDVAAAGYGTGKYEFKIPVDWNTLPAGRYRIEAHAWAANSTTTHYMLPQSPRYYENIGVRITPKKFTLEVGQTAEITASIYNPNNANDTVILHNNNSDIVSLSETGVVTALSPGTAVLTATSQSGTYSATCTITVPSDDPFHPVNIEYVRIKKYDRSAYGGDSDLTTIVVKSSLKNSEYFEIYAPGKTTVTCEINQTLINKLHEFDSKVDNYFGADYMVYVYCRMARKTADSMVQDGQIEANSSEYYGIWVSEANRLIKTTQYAYKQVELVCATITAAYTIYNVVTAIKAAQMSINTTQTISSAAYKVAANNVDDLFLELDATGTNYTKQNTMWIVRKPDGKISWLETGSVESGFKHIVDRHLADFSSFGVQNSTQLSSFIYTTISQNSPIQVTTSGQYIYSIAGKTVSIIISDNGYIVTAYPIT